MIIKYKFFFSFDGISLIDVTIIKTLFVINEGNFFDEENEQVEFNFNSLTKKINNLLDSSKNMDYIDIDELYLVKNKGLKSNASLSMK